MCYIVVKYQCISSCKIKLKNVTRILNYIIINYTNLTVTQKVGTEGDVKYRIILQQIICKKVNSVVSQYQLC